MIESLLYTKLPQDLKGSLVLVDLEKGTYDQIVAHREEELELSRIKKTQNYLHPRW